MSVFREFIRDSQGEHERLRRLLAVWTESVDLTATPELPLAPAPERPFALAEQLLGLRAAFPEIEKPFEPRHASLPARAGDEGKGPEAGGQRGEANADKGESPGIALPASDPAGPSPLDPGEEARQRILGHVDLLGIEIAGLDGALLELLADIVFDSQLSRTLVLPEDSFRVSSVSVLGAIALANLAYACGNEGLDAHHVELPLRVAADHSGRFGPGDLLFWELMALSVAAAPGRPDWSDAAKEVATRHLPAFLAHSILAKLDLAFTLPVETLRSADYRKWPGLATLVAHDGAASIRRALVGRVAMRCADNSSVGTAIVARWFDAMAALGPGVLLPATVLAERFLWELLARREAALAEMAGHGPASAPILAAVSRIEGLRRQALPEDRALAPVHQCLQDIAVCLDDYPVYQGVVQMGRTLAPAAAVPVSAAEGASS